MSAFLSAVSGTPECRSFWVMVLLALLMGSLRAAELWLTSWLPAHSAWLPTAHLKLSRLLQDRFRLGFAL